MKQTKSTWIKTIMLLKPCKKISDKYLSAEELYESFSTQQFLGEGIYITDLNANVKYLYLYKTWVVHGSAPDSVITSRWS